MFTKRDKMYNKSLGHTKLKEFIEFPLHLTINGTIFFRLFLSFNINGTNVAAHKCRQNNNQTYLCRNEENVFEGKTNLQTQNRHHLTFNTISKYIYFNDN